MDYELILGLEIHLQLNTTKKMFCYCKNDPFNSEPNTNICPVCLGLPGALPVPNKDAVIAAQKMAAALGSKLRSNIIFERKNYFYPDLPKGYQITCPHYPISEGGEIDLGYWGYGKIAFTEIHLEEDTGKSIHKSNQTLLDYNKSGVPLLEIVTEPDFRDIEAAVSYCKEIQRIARAINISEADMEKGHMRLEANISLRLKGVKELPHYKVEIKNINSFSFMRKAVQYEIKRQREALSRGEKLVQETRGFSELKNATFSQRGKENANDYRYFPEPDIPEIIFSSDRLANVIDSKIMLPSKIREKFLTQGLRKNYIDVLIDNSQLSDKYNELITIMPENTSDKFNKAASLIINNPSSINLSAEDILQNDVARLTSFFPDSELDFIIEKILIANESNVTQYKSGKTNILQFLIGQVMKETKGKAQPGTIKTKLEEKLK